MKKILLSIALLTGIFPALEAASWYDSVCNFASQLTEPALPEMLHQIKVNHRTKIAPAKPSEYETEETVSELRKAVGICWGSTEITLKAIQTKFSKQPQGVVLSLEQLAPFTEELRAHYHEQRRLIFLLEEKQRQDDKKDLYVRQQTLFQRTTVAVGPQIPADEQTAIQKAAHAQRRAQEALEAEQRALDRRDMRANFEDDATLENNGFAFCKRLGAAYYIPGNDSDYKDQLSTLDPLTTGCTTYSDSANA